ncbi:MazG family protein [Serinibacter arcticus]|uniref:Nucleoside triphosphate pyrophosphohydrolase MazG n=1 Tax=Serinibacter arcticus TaxID=1655435 RepID=A0A4Z1DYW0_9MICO|nr:MazG family protein [Serinibacter arcticus]TGO04190.1 Nucleoside triphosphate pyrophosphohydrolase MazG [Serinibacter arcticus]
MTGWAGPAPEAFDRTAAALLEAVAVMDRLRSPGGCPWDAEQTHASLARYAIEEAHEVAEAAEALEQLDASSSPEATVAAAAAFADELGDLLLQVLFQARIAQERTDGAFDVADVAAGLTAKMRRRHPHVFGDADARDADAVLAMWEDVKAAERAAGGSVPASVMDGVPETLPALMRAQKVLGRAERAGVAVGPDQEADPFDAAAVAAADIGAELLAVVARARALGVDAESALRTQVRAVASQVRAAGR